MEVNDHVAQQMSKPRKQITTPQFASFTCTPAKHAVNWDKHYSMKRLNPYQPTEEIPDAPEPHRELLPAMVRFVFIIVIVSAITISFAAFL